MMNPSPGPRRSAVVSAILVALLALGACLPKPTAWSGDAGPRVGVIGDSLVYNAETGGGLNPNDPDRFLSDLGAEHGLSTSVSAMIGAFTGDLRDVRAFPEPGPEVMVIALGTNDMRDSKIPVGEAVGNIVTYIDSSEARCTTVVTIIDEPRWGLDVTAPPYNAALQALADERDDVMLADWGAVADAHPEYLTDDGIHHNELGKEAYRELIVEAAERCLTETEPDPSTTTTESDVTTTTEPDVTTTTEPDVTTTTEPAGPF